MHTLIQDKVKRTSVDIAAISMSIVPEARDAMTPKRPQGEEKYGERFGVFNTNLKLMIVEPKSQCLLKTGKVQFQN